MGKAPQMVVVEKVTPISRTAYYFTKDGIFRLEGYSGLINWALVICIAFIALSALGGSNIVSIAIAAAIVAFVFIFMALWVYPKERRISDFSINELRKEASAKKIPWKDVSKVAMGKGRLAFWTRDRFWSGRIKGSVSEVTRFFKSLK